MKLVRFLLFPFAILYDLITSIRNLGYDTGIFKSSSFDLPVVAVGNLSVGGTGKSPQIEYLIRLLNQKKLAVLSRGYKRKMKGFVMVNDAHAAQDVGDEPLQFYKKFPNITVAVDANRVEGIQQLSEDKNLELILLDDAYQHRKVKAGFYILLTKYEDLYVDDFILPTGNLRESRRGAKRANIIIVTKCPSDLSITARERIRHRLAPLPHQQVFFSQIAYADMLKGGTTIPVTDLSEYEVLLITGIAWPRPLLDFLDGKGIRYKHLKFPDHHHFSTSDITSITDEYKKLSSTKKIMLTTEKDYVRLHNKIDSLSYLEIETQFLEGQNEFDKKVASFIG